MKSPNLVDIEKSAYAFLLIKYIDQVTDNPRFIVLGFNDVLEEFKSQFNEKYGNGKFVEPEKTRHLEEAFDKREKTVQKCIIAVEDKSLGKYASLLTSFKVLDESVQFSRKKPLLTIGAADIHTPTDITKWLVKTTKNIGDFSAYIKNKLRHRKKFHLELLEVLLGKITKLMESRPSYVEYAHPRKIARGLVRSMAAEPDVSIGFFFREIGIEPTTEVDKIPLFSSLTPNETAELCDKIDKTFKCHASALRKYVSCKVAKRRKNLADLGMNLLRRILYNLASDEIRRGKKWKWVHDFYEFETKVDRRRKYAVKSVGTIVCSRSRTSGLPTCVRFVLSREKKLGENLLIDFHRNKLNQLIGKYVNVVGAPRFRLNSVTMLGKDTLTIELRLDPVLNPFMEGSKKMTQQVNKLLRIIEQRSVPL